MKKEQVEEWADSEVTLHFLDLLKKKLDHVYDLRAGVFFPGNPYQTQEAKAMLIGEESALADVIEAIEEKEFESLEVEEIDSERVGNPSERRPGIN